MGKGFYTNVHNRIMDYFKHLNHNSQHPPYVTCENEIQHVQELREPALQNDRLKSILKISITYVKYNSHSCFVMQIFVVRQMPNVPRVLMKVDLKKRKHSTTMTDK